MRTFINLLLILILSLFNFTFSQVYNWFPLNSGTTNNLNCISGNLIVGSGGIILKSNTSGINWTLIPSGTTNDLKSVYVNGTLAIAVGSNGTIIKSTNSGDNWINIPSGVSNNLNSIYRSTTTQYFAVGTGGKILVSTNTGDSWSSLPSGVSTDLISVNSAGFYVWIVGNNGLYMRSTNYGVNWTQISLGVTTNLNYVFFPNPLSGWIVGDNGKIFKSTDYGANWTSVNSGITATLRSYFQTGWIACDGGNVLRSLNSGINWTLQNVGPNIDWNSIYSSNENAWLAGKNGKIYKRMYDSLYAPWKPFIPNNTGTYIFSTGIFNQDKRTTNTPGFQWPMGSGKFAIFTTGLTIAAKYNGVMRMAAASYLGEYTAGYITDSSGVPVPRTDSRFRLYTVKRGDNASTNQNWAEWGQMVPFGAPYVDVNHNNIYEPAIDTPGYKGASQTIFVCMTDGFASSHTIGEGFGGGTLPLYTEVHLTAWGFDNKPNLENVQFLKWDVINKSKVQWTSAYFSIVCDPDLGYPDDDYIGCDTLRNLGYCYNGDNEDANYGLNPPAVGIQFLNCSPNYASLSSFGFFLSTSIGNVPPCETDPNGEPEGAYNMLKGLKKDLTPWVIPPGGSANYITKYCFPGNPETGAGWDAADGRIGNCGGSLSGPFIPATLADWRFVMNYGSENKTLNPNDTQKVLIAQMIARGTSNLNSVTRLKLLSDTVKTLCNNGSIFGVKELSSQIPNQYRLYQNYPNPFNPVTNIKFDITTEVRGQKSEVRLVIYDIQGREVDVLINQEMKSGSYSADWNANNFASGIYFYSLIIDGIIIDTKKMVLLK